MNWGAVFFLLFMGSCTALLIKYPPPTREEAQAMREAELTAKLPEGCKATDLGSFGEIDQMVAIQCKGRDVISTFSQQNETKLIGKVLTTERHATGIVSIEGGAE